MINEVSHEIDFEPIGRRGRCPAGQSLLQCARELGVEMVSLCGGGGTCGRCKVQVLAGRVSEPTSSEREILSSQELDNSYRLACQTYALGDCRLRIPPESLTTTQRTQVEGLEVTAEPEPRVASYLVELSPPSLSDLRADAERLLSALERQHQAACRAIDIDVLRELSPQLRSFDWRARVSLRDEEVVALGPWPSRQFGLAVDLGTTKIAGYLLDLDSGQTLATQGIMNPQIGYGEDVISRISRAMESPVEAERLQKVVVEALNQLAVDLCARVDAQAAEVIELVVVGNTAMHHLLLRLPVRQLAISPYVPAVRGALDVKAREVGIRVSPGAYVHLLPNIAGFVGADHVAMLLATGLWDDKGMALAMDIGTNTEICLLNEGALTSVSCASGPAFEGAHIEYGMRASAGAIEHLRLADDRIEYQTIGGAPPVGLCGSGVIDAMAQLYLAGVLNPNGSMNADHRRVRVNEGKREYVIVSEQEREGKPAITVTQSDVREIQLAKAAIRTGIQVLLETSGRTEDEIEKVLIAGAFGTYIDLASAVTIGMLPPLPLDRFRQVGNAAGMGAKLALISRSRRSEAQAAAGRVGYVELATAPNFSRTFALANYLGSYRMVHGKKEVVD